ncbi:MAG: hypothetical protein LC745_06975 [Planctomycetia bacterium]|nr:hypothetical protein [Planctomycetia bacterium]
MTGPVTVAEEEEALLLVFRAMRNNGLTLSAACESLVSATTNLPTGRGPAPRKPRPESAPHLKVFGGVP